MPGEGATFLVLLVSFVALTWGVIEDGGTVRGRIVKILAGSFLMALGIYCFIYFQENKNVRQIWGIVAVTYLMMGVAVMATLGLKFEKKGS